MMLRARSSWCAVTRVLAATTMLTTLELDNWAHDTNPSGTKESAGDTRDADDMFREKLISRYDVRVPASKRIMCMVTGISFNPRNVIAGHIISVKNRARAMTILRMHAMDERNGIIWCTAIEKAWSHNQLCFIRPPGAVPMPLPLALTSVGIKLKVKNQPTKTHTSHRGATSGPTYISTRRRFKHV